MNVTLSNNGAFVVTDEEGNMSEGHHGFYLLDTRFLRGVSLQIVPRPEFMGSSSTFEVAFSYFSLDGGTFLVRRRRLGGLYEERLTFYNPSPKPLEIGVKYSYEVPLEDIFQVRGFMGFRGEPSLQGGGFYSRGSNGEWRTLRVESDMKREGEDLTAHFRILPGGSVELFVRFLPEVVGKVSGIIWDNPVGIKNPIFTGSSLDVVFERASEDVTALTLSTVYGPVPLAGLPHFACPFGRDAIITSMFLLPYYPEYARGTLRFLSSIQGRKNDPRSEEEPGKIAHEFRLGMLAHTGRVPFGPYYGAVDTTPLYVALAGEYLLWTGDEVLIESLRRNLTMAVEWILQKLDEGYITYVPGILGNKGWKDSADAIVDEEGRSARPPIALVEVQGYTYWALRLAGSLRLTEFNGGLLLREARKLRKRFNKDFWLEEYYALALDGNGEPLRVVSSNMGHLLITGISEHSEETAERLFHPDMLSKYGVRTLGSEERGYNPFSYHRGSVWPHDNALIALGLAAMGRVDLAKELADRVFAAAELMPRRELPELYSGLDELVPVPRANLPQAWSAASVFALVTASLGMKAREDLVIEPAEGMSLVLRGVKFRGRNYTIRINGGIEIEAS